MDNQKRLLNAIKSKDVSSVRDIVKDPNADVSFRLNTPFQEAAKSGNVEIFNLLLNDKRVNISDLDNYAFGDGVKSDNITIVFSLLNRLNLNYNNLFSGLKTAYRNKNKNIIFEIIKYKTFQEDFKKKNPEGYNLIISFIMKNKLATF
jgi:hypothetical protein